MTDSTTALIYLRSAAENNEAIARQRRACLDHAAAQDWLVIDVFMDNGASGPARRDGFNALCDRVQTGQADVVLTQDPARIARDPDALAAFRRLCDDHAVRLAFTSGAPLDDGAIWRLIEAAEAAHRNAARVEGQDK